MPDTVLPPAGHDVAWERHMRTLTRGALAVIVAGVLAALFLLWRGADAQHESNQRQQQELAKLQTLVNFVAKETGPQGKQDQQQMLNSVEHAVVCDVSKNIAGVNQRGINQVLTTLGYPPVAAGQPIPGCP